MNNIRSILLHLDATAASVARLEFARTLAMRHHATLSVVFAVASTPRSVQLALSERPAGLLQTQERADLEQAKSWFDEALAQGGPPMRWLRADAQNATADFQTLALYADLLVLGQDDPSGLPGGAPEGFIESVLIDSGRPALIVPHAGVAGTTGHAPLIAWNASPQAARAVTAALPWLRAAKQAHVLDETGNGVRDQSGLDIVEYLRLHGVESVLHHQRGSTTPIGDTLLSLAEEVGADLLVMGCYGHSRVSELVLGGASRTVLQAMTLPVLMAN